MKNKKIVIYSVLGLLGILLIILYISMKCLFNKLSELITPISNEVNYTCDDVTVKRIDDVNRTTLYYMQEGIPIDSVWTKYSGFTNSWLDSGLSFLKDSTVMVSGSGWYRDKKHATKRMFRIINRDYPQFFKERIINGKVHVSATDEYKLFVDSMRVRGGYYNIVLVDPETEKKVFNKNNDQTRVVVSKQMPH